MPRPTVGRRRGISRDRGSAGAAPPRRWCRGDPLVLGSERAQIRVAARPRHRRARARRLRPGLLADLRARHPGCGGGRPDGDRLLRRARALRRGPGGGLEARSPSASVRIADGGPRCLRVSVGHGRALSKRMRGAGARRGRRRRCRGPAAVSAELERHAAAPSGGSGGELPTDLRRGVGGLPRRCRPGLRRARASGAARCRVSPRVRARHRHRPWRKRDRRWSRGDPVSARSR